MMTMVAIMLWWVWVCYGILTTNQTYRPRFFCSSVLFSRFVPFTICTIVPHCQRTNPTLTKQNILSIWLIKNWWYGNKKQSCYITWDISHLITYTQSDLNSHCWSWTISRDRWLPVILHRSSIGKNVWHKCAVECGNVYIALFTLYKTCIMHYIRVVLVQYKRCHPNY